MTIYLLSYSHSPYGNNISTGKKLSEDANWKFITIFDNPAFTKDDILIRYGIWKRPEWDNKVKLVFNKAESIRLNCCKALTHYILSKEGVNVPRIEFLTDKVNWNPVITRHKYHSKGKDIKVIANPLKLKTDRDAKAFYYVELIDSEIEYRFHILRDKCIRISRKLPMRTRETVHPWIRSFERGWKLRDKTGWTRNRELEEEAIKECIKALKVIGLDFGAVDVVIQKDTNKPFILELNTAPRLNQLGRKKYIRGFNRLFQDLGVIKSERRIRTEII